jgi:hypothetical protein
METKAIKMLMTHADEKTTGIYLNGGAEAPRDNDLVIVEALMTLAEMLGLSGAKGVKPTSASVLRQPKLSTRTNAANSLIQL